MYEEKIVNKGKEIINFISKKYKIDAYYTEYYNDSINGELLKIVFNYSFLILYDFNKNTLVEIDYDNNEIDITDIFIKYNEQQLNLNNALNLLSEYLEIKAGRIAEPLLKGGKDIHSDENVHKVFLMIAHLDEIKKYLKKQYEII